MKLPQINMGKKKTGENGDTNTAAADGGKPKLDIKSQLKSKLKVASRHQTTIVALAVAGLLALTALRMFYYTDPPADQSRVEDDLSKFKQIKIDSKTVEKINQLQNSGTSTGPAIENGRTNPFSE